ncbi:uridine kinase [Leptolyngbya sp. 15MV]|nr:uridine kinase [Leptolyngbya sp. 15MV]
MEHPYRPVTIAVAGGSGSGKTTVSDEILKRVGSSSIAYVPHDAYYKDINMMRAESRDRINFDHPDALDTQFMIEHIRMLQAGKDIGIPVYDFSKDERTPFTHHVAAQPIILVEGILILAEAELRKLFDVKIYVDTDADLRFIRRLKRDLMERGRTAESVIAQYLDSVRPRHLEWPPGPGCRRGRPARSGGSAGPARPPRPGG